MRSRESAPSYYEWNTSNNDERNIIVVIIRRRKSSWAVDEDMAHITNATDPITAWTAKPLEY